MFQLKKTSSRIKYKKTSTCLIILSITHFSYIQIISEGLLNTTKLPWQEAETALGVLPSTYDLMNTLVT